jgi:hypothetical protein
MKALFTIPTTVTLIAESDEERRFLSHMGGDAVLLPTGTYTTDKELLTITSVEFQRDYWKDIVDE